MKNCELRRYPSNYIIIKQGDVGDSFFVMMKGIIRVYVGYHGDDEIFQQQEQCTGDEYLAHFGTLVRTMQGKYNTPILRLIAKTNSSNGLIFH